MKERLLALARRIREELTELEPLIQRTQEAWHRAQRSSDDFYLDKDLADIAWLLEVYPGLRAQVPEEVLARLF